MPTSMKVKKKILRDQKIGWFYLHFVIATIYILYKPVLV